MTETVSRITVDCISASFNLDYDALGEAQNNDDELLAFFFSILLYKKIHLYKFI